MSASCLFELNGQTILTLFNVKLCYWGGFTFSIWSPIKTCESMRGRRALNRTERHWLDQLCRWAPFMPCKRKTQNPELHFHSAHEPHPTRFCHWKTANFVQLKTSCCFSADILWRRNWVNSVSLTMMLVSVQIPLPVTLHTAHQPNVPFGPHLKSRDPHGILYWPFLYWTPWSRRWEVLRCGHSCFSSQGHEGWLDRWLLPCVTFHQRCCWGWFNWKSELSKLTCARKLQNSANNSKCKWQGNTLRSFRLPTPTSDSPSEP